MNSITAIYHHAAIGDILFLVLIVVASIVQSVVQNKKKKAMEAMAPDDEDEQTDPSTPTVRRTFNPAPAAERPLDNIFDSIERLLIPEVDASKYSWGDNNAEAVQVSKGETEHYGDIDADAKQFIPENEGRRVEPAPMEPLTDYPKVSYKSKIREGFSVKKSVIYSEILNRKYS
jgi:hypothetical protein